MVHTPKQTTRRRGPRVESSSTLSPDYSAIVAGVSRKEAGSLEELEKIFRGGVEFFLSRSGASASSLGTLADECFARVCLQIELGVLVSPAKLPKLIRETVSDMTAVPLSLAANPTQIEQGGRVLAQMSNLGVEALRAYFVSGEVPAAICARLRISENTFEQYKAEAKFLFRALPVQLPQQELKIG